MNVIAMIPMFSFNEIEIVHTAFLPPFQRRKESLPKLTNGFCNPVEGSNRRRSEHRSRHSVQIGQGTAPPDRLRIFGSNYLAWGGEFCSPPPDQKSYHPLTGVAESPGIPLPVALPAAWCKATMDIVLYVSWESSLFFEWAFFLGAS